MTDLELGSRTLENLLDEASWHISHAHALVDLGRDEEAAHDFGVAADCEEHAASLLDATDCEGEAVIHRVSAASCRMRLGQHARAITLLRAALAVPLPSEYRRRVEQLLVRSLLALREASAARVSAPLAAAG